MPYALKYHPDAKKELRWLCETYGESYRQALEAWLERLAANADKKHFVVSTDLLSVLEEIAEQSAQTIREDWLHFWKRFRAAPLREKLKDLITVMRKRCPPRQLRFAPLILPGLDGAISVPTDIVYEIDHVEKRVEVKMFPQ